MGKGLLPKYVTSKNCVGVVRAYAANTYKGLVRDYNEDRVAIILNIGEPKNYKGKVK